MSELSASSPARGSAAAPPVGFGLELEDLFVEHADQRLIVGGDDHHAGIGDSVAPAIFFQVVADQGAARDEHVAVDYRAPDARVTADAHARHQDALLDVRKAVDAHVRTEHAAVNRAARDDAAGRDHRI